MTAPPDRPCLEDGYHAVDAVTACTLPSGHGGPHFDHFEGWSWW